MRHGKRRGAAVPATLLAALLLVLIGVAVKGANGAGPGSTSPAEESPRVVRVVCTDHICGNCDGKCHRKSGHVAVDKKGHCACTPTEGGVLDLATRQAYEKNPPK